MAPQLRYFSKNYDDYFVNDYFQQMNMLTHSIYESFFCNLKEKKNQIQSK